MVTVDVKQQYNNNNNSAHRLMMVYICSKFHENILNGIRVMERTGKVNRRTDRRTEATTSYDPFSTGVKRGNLLICQNYKTITLISRLSKIMLKVNLSPNAEKRIDKKQGPVVQSIVTCSLTSSLRGQLVKCFMTL